MDELIKSCLREIAFDGDYGKLRVQSRVLVVLTNFCCDASRLKTFIEKFYCGNSKTRQNVDDGFRALVWTYIVQHPSVRVGFRPPSVTEDVFIADDIDRSRSKATRRQRYVNQGNRLAHEEGTSLPGLISLRPEEVEDSNLDQLLEKYGQDLRVAVDPEHCFQAITGSTLTPAKLTPMTYSTLQLVARARDKGITFVELSRITGYAAGAVFYLIKVLESAGLVKKFASISGTGIQMAVHIHFWLHHPDWQRIRAEEARDDVDRVSKLEPSGGDDMSVDDGTQQGLDEDIQDSSNLKFDPLDDRHLSRPDLIINRVNKLLEHSKNYCHKQFDVLLRIGLLNPTKVQRKRFSKIINAAVSQGLLERFHVPSRVERPGAPATARVLRLVPGEKRNLKYTAADETSGDADASADADEKEAEAHGQATHQSTRYLATLSLQRNLLNVVNAAGMQGITYVGIIRELGFSEQRMCEGQLQKLSKKANVLPHLSDLGIVLLTETIGRKRQLRLYTTHNFAILLKEEGFEDPDDDHPQEDLQYSGGFLVRSSGDFYRDDAELQKIVDHYDPKRFSDKYIRVIRPPRPGQPEKNRNPIGADGKPKKGRPRKYPEGESRASMARKRKLEEAAAAEITLPPKRQRTSRKSLVSVTPAEPSETGTESVLPESIQAPPVAPKERKKPGRKPKPKPERPTISSIETRPPVSPGSLDQGGLVGGVFATARRPHTRRWRSYEDETTASPSKRHVPAGGISAADLAPLLQLLPPLGPVIDQAGEEANSVDDISPLRTMEAEDLHSLTQTAPTSQDGKVLESPASRRRESAGNPKRLSVSYARRAQDIVEVLKRNHGVLHSGLPLQQAHKEYLTELESSGIRPAGSATTLDRRTISAVIDLLVHNKEVKVLTTDSGAYGQQNRVLKMLYLPDTPMEVVDRYRRSMEKQLKIFSMRKVPPTPLRMEYSEVGRQEKRTLRAQNELPEASSISDDIEVADSNYTIAGLSPIEVRHHILENEPHTVAQLYGLIPGIIWRARELYLFSLHHISVGPAEIDCVVSKPQRIVETKFFQSELPVATWCTLIPVNRYSAALEAYLHTTEGQESSLRNAPERIKRICGSYAVRGAKKLCKVLEILTALRMIQPLEVAERQKSEITCEPHSGYPATFCRRELGPLTTLPSYWQFCNQVPVYDYTQDPAPLLGVHGAGTMEECIDFWNNLEGISNDRQPVGLREDSKPPSFESSLHLQHEFLRRFKLPAGWRQMYRLSAYQQSCIRIMADEILTGSLQPELGIGWLQEISYALAAPVDAVQTYFEQIRRSRLARLNEKKLEHEQNLRRANLGESDSAKVLANKARQTKEILDNSWQALVKQTVETLVPGTFDLNAPELLQVKKNWHLRGGGMNVDNARDRIISAITGTAMPGIKKMQRRYYQPDRHGQLRDVPHCSLCESNLESIKSLVAQQEAEHQAYMSQQEDKRTVTQPRRRYTWTPEYDELALDAEAVIRARCAPEQQPAIHLLTQLFPRLSSNSVRTHALNLRKVRPGGDLYAAQLQAAWNALRLQPHADVPDPLPESLTHFPLEKHVAYLRAHLDKSKLGAALIDEALPPTDNMVYDLPNDMLYIETHWDVVTPKDTVKEWDFMWNTTTDEIRERNMHHEAFMRPRVAEDPLPPLSELNLTHRAETAVKMTVTPSEQDYEYEKATKMLELLGQIPVAVAYDNLKRDGVIKATAERKNASGRAMMVSDLQEEELEGQFDWRLFRDADLLERDLTHLELEPWSVMASDGRTAGILDLISSDLVELTVDTSSATALDIEIGSSSRGMITDEHLENNIYVIAKDKAPVLPSLGRASIMLEKQVADSRHAADNIRCSIGRGGVSNCPQCMNENFPRYLHNLGEPMRMQLCHLRQALREAGGAGLSVEDLQAFCFRSDSSFVHLRRALWDWCQGQVPIIACVGYDTGRIIAAEFLHEWCLQTSQLPFDMVLPRRWLHPSGKRDEALWQMSLRYVMGWIMTRTTISEAILRQRSSVLFDRLEMSSLLQYLVDEKFAVRRTAMQESTPVLIGFSTNEEEAVWHWDMGPVPWYLIH
ncbi:hypothetical protein DACRYDRAFT_113419 [Dacryopinax primogenitus]|uniref:Uncharacterized protein n=1 Tax=Dacryopinax primogenitus (strain DJM 731) TaxID=1858805 RepID=M5GA89_DACPD|nr:uncharacterized protein DACRYDRAFT_113419 [Dacryopinax primogenitus]EJU05245.1 hypothetical protein DACRYDRAFT_113419 [Dacryopinax primogenitus]